MLLSAKTIKSFDLCASFYSLDVFYDKKLIKRKTFNIFYEKIIFRRTSYLIEQYIYLTDYVYKKMVQLEKLILAYYGKFLHCYSSILY